LLEKGDNVAAINSLEGYILTIFLIPQLLSLFFLPATQQKK